MWVVKGKKKAKIIIFNECKHGRKQFGQRFELWDSFELDQPVKDAVQA